VVKVRGKLDWPGFVIFIPLLIVLSLPRGGSLGRRLIETFMEVLRWQALNLCLIAVRSGIWRGSSSRVAINGKEKCQDAKQENNSLKVGLGASPTAEQSTLQTAMIEITAPEVWNAGADNILAQPCRVFGVGLPKHSAAK